MNEEQFKRAIALLSNFKPRVEITLDEIPAPQKLAKFAYALSADVSNGLIGDAEAELANGRFVILHDPMLQSLLNLNQYRWNHRTY